MSSQIVNQFSFLVLFLFSFSGFANPNCLQVEGEYSQKDATSGNTVLLHVEQKGCNQVNVVYDSGGENKFARIMIFNGRPVVYADSIELSTFEIYEIGKDFIKAYATEIDLSKNEEVHTNSKITIDENKNWVEEGKIYLKNHELEANQFKSIYKRLN
jgi:hypothetical protein